MADHKHWKRTLKRNTLNILLVVLVLALLAGVAAAVWTILPLFQRNHTEQPPQEEAEPTWSSCCGPMRRSRTRRTPSRASCRSPANRPSPRPRAIPSAAWRSTMRTGP